MSTVIAMNARDLPADVLTHIFGFVDDVDYRRRVLPLVCKPWASACAGPSPLWRNIAIDADAHAQLTDGRLRWARARRWLLSRRIAIQNLTLRPRHAANAGAIAPLWPALAGSLKTLELALERELLESKPQYDLAGLKHLTALESLKLTGPAAPSCRVSEALVEGLAPLTQLRELSLKLQACPFTMLRPDLPGVLLGALVNLRVLDLDLASFAPPHGAAPVNGEEQAPPSPSTNVSGGNMLPECITRITSLEHLRLAGDWRRPKVVLPPDFAALTALKSMTLTTLYLGREASTSSGFTPAPQPAPATLERIVLQDCTGDFPFGSGLAALRVLRLEACDDMHMSAAAMEALREARRLDATVLIRDTSLEHLPQFLDGLPPSYRLHTAKPPRHSE